MNPSFNMTCCLTELTEKHAGDQWNDGGLSEIYLSTVGGQKSFTSHLAIARKQLHVFGGFVGLGQWSK